MLEPERARAAEELDVLGVRPWISALDEVDAEAVEQLGNLQLVLDREAEALALRPITQRGVEEVDIHDVLRVSVEAEPRSL